MGSILQVSISPGGLPKRAVASAVATSSGLEGDSWAKPQFHGGPDQAVLLLANEVLEELRRRGYPVFPGALGENITTVGIDPREWRIGQIWRVGLARVQFTKVRTPCRTIKVYGDRIGHETYDARVKSGDPSSPVWCWGGMYGRILAEGNIGRGDKLTLESENA